MTLAFSSGTKQVTITETDIFDPITTQTYYGLYIFIKPALITTNDIIIREYIWNPVASEYELFKDPYTQVGATNDTAKLIPIIPLRRFKVTVQRTNGLGANVDYNIHYDIITQTG